MKDSITDYFCSPALTKLAKEKGFNGLPVSAGKIFLHEQLARWLQFKHGIYCIIDLDITASWFYKIGPQSPESTYKGNWFKDQEVFSKKHDAWEKGLTEALKLIP